MIPGYLFAVKHNWKTMTEAIQNHIGSLNWSYRLSLREKAVAYVNSYGEFIEHHKIKVLLEYFVLFIAFLYYCLYLPWTKIPRRMLNGIASIYSAMHAQVFFPLFVDSTCLAKLKKFPFKELFKVLWCCLLITILKEKMFKQ